MRTLTFTQKLLRQRSFLTSLIPLFALFVGLGMSQTAQAQITSSAITLNVKGASSTYNTQATTAGGGNFFNQDFGTFNTSVPSDVFQITGGTVSVQEAVTPGSAVYDQGELLFRVFTGDINAAVSNSNSDYASIDLGTGVLDVNNVRTFTLSNANRNLIASAVSSVAPGTSNRLDVRFVVSDNNVTAGLLRTVVRKSVFTVVNPPVNGATISNPTVIVDQGAGSVTYNAAAFNGTTLVDQQSGSTTAPKFDINNGRLILKGGSVTTTETGAAVVNGAFLDYTVYSPNYASVIINGTLQLAQQGAATSGVRNFTLTTGTTNLISLAALAGDGYIIAVTYHATYQNNGIGAPVRINDSSTYNALFDVAGTKTPPSTVSANTISIAPDGGADVDYNINPATPRPFNGANLSAPANNGVNYDVNNGQLRLNATTVTTTEAGANTIGSVILYYRTRLAGTPGGAYQPLTLTQSGNTVNGVRTFVLNPAFAGSNPQPNLIASAAVTAAGTYTLDVYYQANGTNNGVPFTITDPPGAPISAPYSANFTVTGTSVAQTIWTGAVNDNWFDIRNWSNGIPNENINALVRDLGAGNSVPYPNIYSDAENKTASGTLLYSNLNSGPAKARNLIMGGSSQAARSIARLIVGRLQVYGDFDNRYASFIQRENTVVEFAGGNQAITGGSFQAVEITGSGTKTSNGLMEVAQSITFISGILATDISQPLVSLIVLADRAPINNNNGAQLIGENDVTYLRGFVRTIRQNVLVSETRTYGNMGMTLTFDAPNSPGNVEITRNTVEAYSPVSGRFGIRRIFGVRPSDQATNTGGLSATMVFRYRDSETQNLDGPSLSAPGAGSIPEANLIIFLSTNSGNTFGALGRDGAVDVDNNTVTKSGVRSFATFTLGDSERPLPVRLTAFDAKRMGSDALITWQTANELNSKGYEVQVSTNSTDFRTLGFIASASPNSTRLLSYSFVDKEANKDGLRYYRLRQIDINGKEEFFAPKSVSFEGKANIASSIVAYPNPFNSSDELHIATQISKGGKGQLRITDMTGRTIHQETVELASGIADVTVGGMKELKAGIYLVRLTLPTGETQNLKVVKQ